MSFTISCCCCPLKYYYYKYFSSSYFISLRNSTYACERINSNIFYMLKLYKTFLKPTQPIVPQLPWDPWDKQRLQRAKDYSNPHICFNVMGKATYNLQQQFPTRHAAPANI